MLAITALCDLDHMARMACSVALVPLLPALKICGMAQCGVHCGRLLKIPCTTQIW